MLCVLLYELNVLCSFQLLHFQLYCWIFSIATIEGYLSIGCVKLFTTVVPTCFSS